MAEILLVNPRKRKSARRKKPVARKKARSAAQKRATAKMIAANRRRNPRRRKTVARKRRRGKSAVARTRRRSTPLRRRARQARRRVRRVTRRRSNPRLNMRSIQNQLMEAGTGAVGALGLDVIQGYLPIPENLKTGLVGTGVKALLAIGMGIVASNVKIVRGATANKMVNGALTVVLHDELKKQVQNFAPGIQMGTYLTGDNSLGYVGSGYPAGVMGEEYGGMGTYLPELSTTDMRMEEDGLGAYEEQPDLYMQDLSFAN